MPPIEDVPVIVNVSLATSEANYDATVTFLEKPFRIVRIGTDGDVDRAEELIKEWTDEATVFAITGARDARTTGILSGDEKAALRQLEAATGETVTTNGHRLRDVLQEWTVRMVSADKPGIFSNARTVVLGGSNHRRTARVLNEQTPNIRFADAILTYGLPSMLDFEGLDRFVGVSKWVLDKVPDPIATPITAPGRRFNQSMLKKAVTDADVLVVYAKTDPDAGSRGITAFVVDRQDGITIDKKEDKMGQRASNTATVTFNDVEVPAENLLGEENKGFKLAMMTLDRTRPGVAAMAVGIARAAMEAAADYSKERQQFGVPIAMHQAIQFLIADMSVKVDAARLLTWLSAWQLDNGQRNTLSSSQAKRFAADSAMEVTTDAVQVFGGYGFIKEYPVEKFMRDAKIMQLYEGTSQIQRMVIAREILLPRNV